MSRSSAPSSFISRAIATVPLAPVTLKTSKLLVNIQPKVETIYEDDEARLLKIREVKGVAPDEANDAPETPEEKKILDELEKNEAPKSNSNIDKDDDN